MSDPFGGDGDRTIMKPMSGGLRQQNPDTTQSPPPPAATPGAEEISIRQGGANPLLNHSAPLFALVNQLRTSVSHPDPLALQVQVGQDIVNFENAARHAGEPSESVLAARYIICTVLDEMALSTPWGVESQWASQTLLVRFHNEASGGEKFFQILERLLHDPARNLHLLEFMYVCLSLGFEGRYRLQPRGAAELEQIRLSLYDTLRTFKGTPPHELSLSWRGVEYNRPRLAQYVPLWVLCAAGAGLCLLVFVGLLFTLNVQSEPTVTRIAGLARESVPLETRQALPPPVLARTLTSVMQADPGVAAAIDRGEVQVEEAGAQALVRLWGLFPSGQGEVSSEAGSLVDMVAGALNEFSGRIRVVGHTDDEPIRSLRFPSNWELSDTRAQSVSSRLEQLVDSARVASEGRADTDSLVANDSAINRALNRRIEITLFYDTGEL